MNIKAIFTAVAALLLITAEAQNTNRTSFIIPRGATTNGITASDPHVNVRRIEHPKQSSSGLETIKDSLSMRYANQDVHAQTRLSTLPAPVVGFGVQGNVFNNGTPTDNEIAVGNNGMLISVQNSNVFRYNTNTSTPLTNQSLAGFFAPLQNNGSKYDPKVLYDPQANRFILMCLAGYTSSNTNLLVGFSNSDSINGTWHLYEIPGNPFGDTAWSDYPMIAVNNNELFLTVNQVYDGQPWQTGFKETFIWQINKWDGYSGDSLRTQLHSGINTNGRPVRNLCPVEHAGAPTSSPAMYFLSDRNLDASNDTIFLVTITDTINAPGQQLTVQMMESNTSYFAPIQADQPGSGGQLSTNDARIQGAYLLNNTIQFVNATTDTATGNVGIYHGVVSNVNTSPTVRGTIYADTLLDYGYPNLAWVGYDASDYTSMIMFLHSAASVNPGYSVMLADTSGNFSVRTNAKSGTGAVSLLSGDERWGDYTGIQRRYDIGGTCWVNGYYGMSNGAHSTWICEVGRSSDVSVQQNTTSSEIQLYPNPVTEQLNITFNLETSRNVRFVVYDMQGRMVQILVEDQFRAGKHVLTFNPDFAGAGMYIIRGECADGSVLFTERFISE
ncbi:MAG: hypothetical protein RL007_1210 [Bacteroidota bacterium]|jgi:hypothetical protein